MLYTGKQIAEKYNIEDVTPATIRRWANKGLKHIVGRRGVFLYKEEWVEKFIEQEAERQVCVKPEEFQENKKKIPKNRLVKFDMTNRKII